MVVLRICALLSILFSGLISGFFYAWVCSTMWGLDTLPPDIAIQAMNAMNVSVRNAVFLPTFFLTPIVLGLTGLFALFLRSWTVGSVFVAAAGLYFFGAFLPTAMVNVPMNLALETVDVSQSVGTLQDIWNAYSEKWQFWNQLRTGASASALLLAGWGLLKIPSTMP